MGICGEELMPRKRTGNPRRVKLCSLCGQPPKQLSASLSVEIDRHVQQWIHLEEENTELKVFYASGLVCVWSLIWRRGMAAGHSVRLVYNVLLATCRLTRDPDVCEAQQHRDNAVAQATRLCSSELVDELWWPISDSSHSLHLHTPPYSTPNSHLMYSIL